MRTDRYGRVRGFEAGNSSKEEKEEISDIIRVIDIIIKLLCPCVRGAYMA